MDIQFKNDKGFYIYFKDKRNLFCITMTLEKKTVKKSK